MSAITVRKVSDKNDLKTFFEFPWTIYKNDPNWVPPLLSTRKGLLDKNKNPSWEYLKGDYFVAWRGTEPVGTIAAFINRLHNETWNEDIGWFGCFECYDDQEIANALLRTAEEHVKTLSPTSTAIRGPAQFTVNDELGLLIENFSQPILLMPYNPPYYQRLIEGSGRGYAKEMDVVSYYANPEILLWDNGHMPEKFTRVVEKTMQRNGITLRQPDPKRLKQELELLRQVYVSAWEKNWGNVPPTDHEMDKMFEDLKDFVVPELSLFAMVKGEIAGFFMSLPDMNQVLKHAYPHPGEPEVITLLKALWHWKIRPKITGQRVLLFGVKPEFRNLGVDAALYKAFYELAAKSKYPNIDAGWILETNQPVHAIGKTMHAQLYKRYRIYQKSFS